MRRYLKTKYILGLVLVLFLSACAEDLGNYDYSEINEVTINGIESEYEALTGEPFKITTELQFTLDSDVDDQNYEYKWSAINPSLVPADQEEFLLGDTKNLDVTSLKLTPGEYSGYFRVTDKETGVYWVKKFKITVKTTIYEGWLAMSDVNGATRLDMLSYIDNQYKFIPDVLDYVGSELTLKGAPENVYCFPYDAQKYGIYLTSSETGTTKIDPDTFGWALEDYLSFEMLSNVPTDFKADFIEEVGSWSSLMHSDGNFYYWFRIYRWNYDLPINIVNGETQYFEAAPHLGAADGYGSDVIYDNTNKRFVRHPYNTKECYEMADGSYFSYHTGNKELVYMKRTDYNGGEVFALLKDPDNNDLFLARMASRRWNSVISQVGYDQIPAEIAADMVNADNYAIDPTFGYIFYNVGSKLYQYDLGLKTSKLMLDKGANDISLVTYIKRSPVSKKLIVASYDAGAANGTMEIYSVPAVNGDLTLEQSYEGFGKIVSLSYRQR
ncbi:PKD-like family protein [Zhouia amylolytica]|uniref:PKD-like family protein n=1 Tax=Zhouia amylolytica TaxID=376730 RepID=A0A1I6RK73_9FLAO|nr:PKD-like family lipoprotein [Zhouia amylolytica]SFS65054.1 PKD-like family protein [Zhouia amylolytica]